MDDPTPNSTTPPMRGDSSDLEIESGDCIGCGEGFPTRECSKSLRLCGHHCNHLEVSDTCHWCGGTYDEEGELVLAAKELEATP